MRDREGGRMRSGRRGERLRIGRRGEGEEGSRAL